MDARRCQIGYKARLCIEVDVSYVPWGEGWRGAEKREGWPIWMDAQDQRILPGLGISTAAPFNDPKGLEMFKEWGYDDIKDVWIVLE